MSTLRPSRFDAMPLVGAVMTPFPFFVHPGDPIERVSELMESHDIRHIPVHDGQAPVGVISDLEMAAARRGQSAADVMLPDPYVVGIGARLSDVAREMGQRRCGAALVVRRDKLAGILSVTDACRLLADVLEDSFPGGGDHAA